MALFSQMLLVGGASAGVLQLTGGSSDITMNGARLKASCLDDAPRWVVLSPTTVKAHTAETPNSINVSFISVPPSCVDVPIEKPCADQSDMPRPALFWCSFSGSGGSEVMGPYHAFTVPQSAHGISLGLEVRLECKLPPMESLERAAGYRGDGTVQTLNVSVSHFPAGSEGQLDRASNP